MSIKLTYFDSRGLAELSRLILVAADQKFVDEKITREEWDSGRKTKTKFNTLPTLTYNEKCYGQSLAIAQFLAREFGFYGEGNEEALRVDEAVQLLVDIQKTLVTIMYEKDAERKEELTKKAKESFATSLKHLEGLAVDNGKTEFFVGSKLSTADLMLFTLWDYVKNFVPEAESDDHHPELKKIIQSVVSDPFIKPYLVTRDKTQH